MRTRVIYEDIWKFHQVTERSVVVIPTNAGWDNYGDAVMGAGLALQAKKRFPDLPVRYGKILRERMDNSVVFIRKYSLIMLPTKPLNADSPHLSWQSKSDFALVEQGCHTLVTMAKDLNLRNILVPALGCGLGGLKECQVVPIMKKVLLADRFWIVLI